MRKISSFEDLRLWKDVLVPKGTDQQRAMVAAWIEQSEALTAFIVETFPTYTIHDARHARNVAELIADLIGDRIAEATALEAAFLLLAAYYHDIGMVFLREEREALTKEEGWADFLGENPAALLTMRRVSNGAEPPVDIAEWFCRWRHAERVRVWVRRLAKQPSPGPLKWNGQDIGPRLEELCRSHNLAIGDLSLKDLPNDFRANEADLFFCAILLRLADILDFDRSRSPEAVYRYLGLAKATTKREAISESEWSKHLASEGMVFPATRSDRYEIDFLAAPRHPAVEYDVREFLDIIEHEFQGCRSEMHKVSPRWRALPLPGTVDRRHIESQDYVYGALRFTLDQENIVELLMGENLYSDPFVFVRELLQNAIDASRVREHLTRAIQPNFQCPAIKIGHWRSGDGYEWIRFDDFGIGMDEQIVRDFLLKVGRSYYRSAQFEAAVLQSQGATTVFSPISRFGIGLLSCFIAGDVVDVNTRRWRASGPGQQLRFGLRGLHGFMVLQHPPLQPAPMPASDGDETQYRSQPGTSISVRINPHRYRLPADIGSRLKKLLLCCPVGVQLNDEDVGATAAEGWTVGRHTISLAGPELASIEQSTFFPVAGLVRVHVDVIDLGTLLATKGISGRLLFASIEKDETLEITLEQNENLLQLGTSVGFNDRDGTLEIRMSLSFNKSILDQIREMAPEELSGLPPEIRECVVRVAKQMPPGRTNSYRRFGRNDSVEFYTAGDFASPLDRLENLLGLSENPGFNSDFWFALSHSGIRLPLRGARDNARDNLLFRSPIPDSKCLGFVSLTGDLRPGLSLSREHLQELPWELFVAIEYAVRKYFHDIGARMDESLRADVLAGSGLCDFPSIARLEAIGQVLDWENWHSIPIFDTDRGMLEIDEILQTVRRGEVVFVRAPRPRDFLSDSGWSYDSGRTIAIVQAFLLSTRLELEPESNPRDHNNARIVRERKTPVTDQERAFVPSLFVKLERAEPFRLNSFINATHPLADWLIQSSQQLQEQHPVAWNLLISVLHSSSLVDDPEQIRSTLVEALELVRAIDPKLVPASKTWPKLADFQ